jgi:hypothetical protein
MKSPQHTTPSTHSRNLLAGAIGALLACLALLATVPAAKAAGPLTASGFGFTNASVSLTPAPGLSPTQAGSHPEELTIDLAFANKEDVPTGGEVRDLNVTLPPGLIGNPNGVPQCPRALLDTPFEAHCPADTQIGIVKVITGNGKGSTFPLEPRLFNMAPPPGVPAEFAFSISGISAILDANVGTPAEHYAVKVKVHDITQRQVLSAITTIWDLPSEHVAGGASKPFLTLPTTCSGPQRWHFAADTWEAPGVFAETEAQTPSITGCEHLGFGPSLSIHPQESSADTPTGVSALFSAPPEGLLAPEGLAGANTKNTIATLPVGVDVNAGAANGLEFCQPSQEALDNPESQPSCPVSSKLGTDEVRTPVLAERLAGNVYLLPSNPPELKVLVAASGAGVNLKLIGEAHLDAATGQITASFKETPDLPVGTLELHFPSGANAIVDTPTKCGSYTSNSDITPWASPLVSDVFDASSFTITGYPGAAPCPASAPFAPTILAGGDSVGAGQFTSFSLQLHHQDGEQRISALQTTLPAGLAATISSVPRCGQPQASQGTCPSASAIGHVITVAGAGSSPLTLPQPGQPPALVYLTGPYEGAPFGLSIVVPVVAGPFNLGTVVVRARIDVDPHTAQVTVTTDPSGPFAIPHIIDGVPVDLRAVDVTIDRDGFMFNPTGCSSSAVTGVVAGTEGGAASVSSPFRIGGCRGLAFKPDFKVTTSAHTSRANGASLDAKVVFPKGSFGGPQGATESNIKSVKVDLPKQLPSRLTTLQKACTEATFEANPASCPAASRVGIARASTPVLQTMLTGPVYFVSHGGAKFPDLVVVLQGEGIRVDLVAGTSIKHGITSSTFKSVPDVPVSSFELYLPTGQFSALGAFGNFCTSSLPMPTEFTAESGAVIHQTTKIAVTGCAGANKASRARKATSRGGTPAGEGARTHGRSTR